MMPPYWESDRLFVRDAVLDKDVKGLQKLWESTAYIGEYDGHPERASDDMYKNLTHGPELPPGGSGEFARIQPFFSKMNSEMLGYITMYHGYPDKETLWIAFFCVHPNAQGKGYGQEVVHQLAAEAKTQGFRRLMLIVALKNWSAIRFWTNAGFDKITGFYGDKTHGTDAFANLALERSCM